LNKQKLDLLDSAQWEAKLGVAVSGYFLQRMKTKWGGCMLATLRAKAALPVH
jgi:predicted metal-dependent hydrolase